ncbi:hypothetical protein CMI47_19080 [Candidatus Pacearchaeota archaeon]|nr:hypothetical protein [Candidatus Pacearchaeota archaeon]|tara:strand:- start:44 stop:295 length:252 start_codon:yes stop_codon:yes gene_type:complete
MKKQLLTQFSNNYLFGDRVQCVKSGKLGTIMEVWPLKSIQVVWDDWVRVRLPVSDDLNPGYVPGIRKVIGESFIPDGLDSDGA